MIIFPFGVLITFVAVPFLALFGQIAHLFIFFLGHKDDRKQKQHHPYSEVVPQPQFHPN